MEIAIIKALIAILNDEKTRKNIGIVIGILLSPFIIIIVIFSALFSTSANHNTNMVLYSFNNAPLSSNIELKYKEQIEQMREHFAKLDEEINIVNEKMENGKSLDNVRIKAIFYVLAYEKIYVDYKKLVDCFVVYNVKEKEIQNEDNEIEKIKYEIAVQIKNLARVYENIQIVINKTITNEMIFNANEIYYLVKYGKSSMTTGKDFDDFVNNLPQINEEPLISVDGFVSPIAGNWQKYVTSEFGNRVDPFNNVIKGHGAIDIAKPKGTPIFAALDGVVKLARNTNNGYGKHIILDNGSGFVTLYGHCSKINVMEGERVKAGEKIAEVGSTGRSTGNHLHFEVRVNGKKQDPRKYMP